jgi:hypothetical protein
MSIRDIRIQKKLNEIIRRNLQYGYVPTSKEVISQITSYMKKHNLSLPNYQFTYQDVTEEMLDTTLDDTSEDLQIIYKALIEIYTITEQQINKLDTEKEQYNYRLKTLESTLESLINQYIERNCIFSHIENFADINSINTNTTTANIDIKYQHATLNKFYDNIISDYSIVATSKDTIIKNGSIKNYIEHKGLVWQGTISKSEQEVTALDFIIDAKATQEINQIEISMPLIKPANLIVAVSNDKHKWNEITRQEITDKTSIYFNEPIRYIKLTVVKTEADKFLASEYQYIFLLDTITLHTNNYKEESTIITKPIELIGNISHVAIEQDAIIPSSSSIEYYVSPNNNGVWIELDSTYGLNFNNITEGQVLNLTTNELGYYYLSDKTVNGQKLYCITELNNVDKITSYKLYKGLDSWKVKSLSADLSGPQESSITVMQPPTYIPINTVKDSIVVNSSQAASQNTITSYSLAIEYSGDNTIINAPLNTNVPTTIYLNNRTVYRGSSNAQVTYPISKGQNVITIVTNCPAGTAAQVDIGLRLKEIGNRLLAEPEAMQYVSLFDLKYNTNNRNDVYTIYQNMVVVKGLEENLTYSLNYNYLNRQINNIVIKAVLKRHYSAINVTPQLNSFKVRCS